MFKSIILFIAGALIGLVGASYLFILQGYQTEVLSSERRYQLVKEGKVQILALNQSEVRSNGYVLEVFGTVENHALQPIHRGKVSADLFDAQGKFIHKCEHWIPVVRKKSQYNFTFHCANLVDLKPREYATSKVYID
jgi:hypothetical protein